MVSDEWPSPDLLARQATESPERLALIDADDGQAWDYEALSEGPVDRLAAGIEAAGLSPGDHLGVLAEPGVPLAQLVHAAARVGVVFVPLPPEAPVPAVCGRCSAADIDVLVVADSSVGAVPTGIDRPVVPMDELKRTEGASTPYRWARDDVQWLVFTSGTLGDPRPVQLTAGNLIASASASRRRLGVTSEDRWLACLPMHHVGGLAPLVRASLDGTTVVVQGGFDPVRTEAAMVDHEVTGVSLVPTMLDRLFDAGWRPPDSLRFVLLGGAPAGPELIDRCEAVGVPVFPTYGATESASQIATATPAEAFEYRGTVGRPLERVSVRVEDDAGQTLSAGETGELVVSGPTVSPGYYDEAHPTEERFAEDGAFHTRDRGYRDAANRLWVVGRLDDAITTGGETVQPDAVEAVLLDHPDVAEAAVVGIDDEEWGQVVAALVTATGSREVDTDAVLAHSRERLDPVAVPKSIVVADSLPRTASGTVDRTAVRERLRGAGRSGGL